MPFWKLKRSFGTSQPRVLSTASIDTSHRGHLPNDLTNLVSRDGHDPIASGGFADIYRGMLQHNGQSMRVAIKAIKTYSGEDSGTIFSKKQKRLRREIRVWLDLQHDNVLPFLGTTMGFGRFPAMVCPWAEHGCLTSYLEDRYESLSAVKILGLLNDVASGIHYLHSRSIVHGDLSGSNVLIPDSGRACIADFGLSMLLSELGGSTFATSFHGRGTLRWTAPELLDLEVPAEEITDEESPPVGPTTQSDVYSFGSVMLQILSGKVPYHYYKRDGQVLHAISKGKTPERPSIALVTEHRWMFIQRCWTLVDPAHSRPLGEEIVKFTEEELAAHEESNSAGLHAQLHTSTRQDSMRPESSPNPAMSGAATPMNVDREVDGVPLHIPKELHDLSMPIEPSEHISIHDQHSPGRFTNPLTPRRYSPNIFITSPVSSSRITSSHTTSASPDVRTALSAIAKPGPDQSLLGAYTHRQPRLMRDADDDDSEGSGENDLGRTIIHSHQDNSPNVVLSSTVSSSRTTSSRTTSASPDVHVALSAIPKPGPDLSLLGAYASRQPRLMHDPDDDDSEGSDVEESLAKH